MTPSQLRLEGLDHPWVSRGGMKLAEGLKVFDISPTGLVCLDIGASTGGFTDVLLHHGLPKSMRSMSAMTSWSPS
jgi:23S rRNA (cytidine1920-2'-O)/16S rRNA (cytidine1409-2'-O)-methyltransferase